MTKEEYLSEYGRLADRLQELNNEIRKTKTEICETASEFCNTLNKEYGQYMKKKILLTFTRPYSTKQSYVEGYFNGFTVEFGDVIRPVIHKAKKDGTMSKNVFPLYEVGDFQSMTDIKILNDGE